MLLLDAVYRGNDVVCVSVFVGVHESLHSFLWMCVSELSKDKLMFSGLDFSLSPRSLYRAGTLPGRSHPEETEDNTS